MGRALRRTRPRSCRAIPIAAVLATLVNVIVLDNDPAEEDVPTVIFPARDAEAG